MKIVELVEITKSYFLNYCNNSKFLYSVLCAFGVYKIVYYAFFDGLRGIPGPWASRFTFYPIRKALVSGETTRYLLSLHKKYGPVVRIGPNWVSDSRVSDFKKVMATHRFRKSSDYDGFAGVHQNIFSTRDEEFNRMRRRQIGPAFSHTGLDSVESIVQSICVDSLIDKLGEMVDNGAGSAQFNYFKYLQNTTADVIGELAFGERFYALENDGHPVTGWVNESLKNSFIFSSFPILRYFQNIIPGLTIIEPELRQFCLDAIKRRKDLVKSGKFSNDRIDILQMYLVAVNNSDKKPLSNNELIAEMVIMVLAGVDTTSITLTWLITYYMLYPKVYQRVVEEVRSNFPNKEHKITHKESREKLPYFVATVYEALRIRGAVGGALAREVPMEGIELSGYQIPQGTNVFMFVPGAHQDTQVWGNDVSFNPERFLGPQGESLKKEILAFSTGVRMCPGRK
ncbi:Isotrichodermin C-15 hydroxylase [Smittium mucronatum]|uniref:Isotrichodermin C-15 hydroxylase n=1 Tax=Smittium mucronatum TaxID=133383 RepID=A0A1R0H046_9FUNG|nr:Isotrichodermin C-15 hydroxylase [Smittium mucronatum]